MLDRRATGAVAVVQAWMTGTDRALFEGLDGRAQFFRVEDAALTAETTP